MEGVYCEECGVPADVSARQLRRIRHDGHEWRCLDCRRPEIDPAERVKLAAWWAERFDADELHQLGSGIF